MALGDVEILVSIEIKIYTRDNGKPRRGVHACLDSSLAYCVQFPKTGENVTEAVVVDTALCSSEKCLGCMVATAPVAQIDSAWLQISKLRTCSAIINYPTRSSSSG